MIDTDICIAGHDHLLRKQVQRPCEVIAGEWRLFGFEQFSDHVIVLAKHALTRENRHYRCRLLIDCEGPAGLIAPFLNIDYVDGVPSHHGRGRVYLRTAPHLLQLMQDA